MAISESWLTPSIPDSFLSIENYELCRKDRTGKTSGGVAFYVSQKYAHLISKFETETETLKLVVHFLHPNTHHHYCHLQASKCQ